MIRSILPRLLAHRELWTRVLPLTAGVLLAGVAASYVQHGFLIGGTRGVPLAGPDCQAELWQLLLLGFTAGYGMALVGGATGLVSLPVNLSLFGFTTVSVSPTVQLETFLNPFGALLGFRRQGQWNLDFALPLCAGAAVGALAGPFIRIFWLSDPAPFKAAVGVALLFVASQMLSRLRPQPTAAADPRSPPTSARAMRIHTVSRGWTYLAIDYGEGSRRLSIPRLVLLGAGVGVVGTTLGVGGGFLLVPVLAEYYRLPMRVIVAASIPFVIVLSGAGLLTFNLGVPLVTGQRVPTEWAWGCFTGGGAILGSWCATHSQHHVPDWALRLLLGLSNGAVGTVYVLDFVGVAPLRL